LHVRALLTANRVIGVARLVPIGVCWVAVVVGVIGAVATGASEAVTSVTTVRTTVGPTRLVSSGFGYSVAYRTVAHGATAQTEIGLFLYADGRWRNVTPPTLRADGIDGIDDVAFIDRLHGWVAAYNCATVAVHLYRTRDGGRSWQSLGTPASHSCGGGPTYLSFIDNEHGWMEPVSPNGPVGQLLGTSDGGRTWKQLASGPSGHIAPGTGQLPCLAPIRFVSPSTGWMARCGNGAAFTTHDHGRLWRRTVIRVSDGADAHFDVPWFDGRAGVVAATIGSRPATANAETRAVAFSTSRDSGKDWTFQAVRTIASCPLIPYSTSLWPASVVDAHLWWIVAGRGQPLVQVTTDAGRQWHTVLARGLPTHPCSVTSVSAASSRVAWVIARGQGSNSGLYYTSDGGRTWHLTVLLRR
jgi:photosystem II stability/assembly factor-like uncharacterized protein